MEVNVLMLGSGASRVLARPGRTGTVHSLFEHTVNLVVEDKIISFQHSHVPKTPLALTVGPATSLRDLQFSSGAHVLIKQDCVIVKGHKFNFGAARSWEGRLPVFITTGEQISLLMTGVFQALRLSAPPLGLEGFGSTPLFPRGGFRAPGLANPVLQFPEKGKERDWIPALTDLIGLGPGLTPSGDDFLIGFLSVLSLLEGQNRRLDDFASALQRAISEAGAQTTTLSREFLLYACSGEYSEPFHDLYRAAVSLDAQETLAAAIRFTGIGHTSGADGLTGVLYGLKLCRRIM